MKLLLLGSNGQVGRELERTLAHLGHVTALDRAQLDITDRDKIAEAVRAASTKAQFAATVSHEVRKGEEVPSAPKGPTQEELLTDIRNLLATGRPEVARGGKRGPAGTL